MRHRTPITIERILKRTVYDPQSHCWLWLGALGTHGYPVMSAFRGCVLTLHRKMWELCNGPIPEGLHVLHRCDVRRCVNPEHLFLGTHRDNMDDMIKKGRAVHRGARLLKPDQVREIRSLYKQGGIRYKDLARGFEVPEARIHSALNGWKTLDKYENER